MSSKQVMKDFIFSKRLLSDLNIVTSDPEILQLIPVLCFHGFAGVGKTSFARMLCDDLCSDVQYFALNERALMNSFIEKEINPILRTRSLMRQEGKTFSRGLILDEFSNLSPKDQDKFKVVLDDLVDTFVIICLNTTKSKPLFKCVTQPIYSRLHHINFNIRDEKHELNEVVGKVCEKYPLLSKDKVHAWLPDMRRISREGKLSELMKN